MSGSPRLRLSGAEARAERGSFPRREAGGRAWLFPVAGPAGEQGPCPDPTNSRGWVTPPRLQVSPLQLPLAHPVRGLSRGGCSRAPGLPGSPPLPWAEQCGVPRLAVAGRGCAHPARSALSQGRGALSLPVAKGPSGRSPSSRWSGQICPHGTVGLAAPAGTSFTTVSPAPPAWGSATPNPPVMRCVLEALWQFFCVFFLSGLFFAPLGRRLTPPCLRLVPP